MTKATMEKCIRLYVDGLCFPNNPGGWACYGWLAVEAQGQPDGDQQGPEVKRLDEGTGCVGHGPDMTNNVAEYHATIAALTWARKQGYSDIELLSDSQLVINQVTGKCSCNSPHLKELLAKVAALTKGVGVTFRWIRREENEEADALSRKAYKEETGDDATPQAHVIPATKKQLDYLRLLGWNGDRGQVKSMAQASELIDALKTAKRMKG